MIFVTLEMHVLLLQKVLTVNWLYIHYVRRQHLDFLAMNKFADIHVVLKHRVSHCIGFQLKSGR